MLCVSFAPLRIFELSAQRFPSCNHRLIIVIDVLHSAVFRSCVECPQEGSGIEEEDDLTVESKDELLDDDESASFRGSSSVPPSAVVEDESLDEDAAEQDEDDPEQLQQVSEEEQEQGDVEQTPLGEEAEVQQVCSKPKPLILNTKH